MGKQISVGKAFIILLLLFLPMVNTQAFGFDFTNFQNRQESHREYFSRMLEKLCAVRIKIHDKHPRFPVPRICKTKEAELPTLEFYAEPTSITEGGSVVLNWASDNTLSCEASSGWSGEKTPSGTEEVIPLETTTYTLMCDGVGEGIEKSIIVEVLSVPEPGQEAEKVVINEIAWMGSLVSNNATTNSNAEWIELRNLTGNDIDLSGWSLIAEDGTPSVSIPTATCPNVIIPANGLYLLIRTNDSVLDVSADCVYTGAMGNGGEVLDLKNNSAELVDSVNGAPDWEIGGTPTKGDNTTKDTAQRAENDTWFTAIPTPKATNSI